MKEQAEGAPVPPYRIHLRIQNNRLWRAIQGRYPDVKSVRQAALLLGVNATSLGDYLNMRKPLFYVDRWGKVRYRDDAGRIADTLGARMEELFDPELYGRKAKPMMIEIDTPNLALMGLAPMPALPSAKVEAAEREAIVADVLKKYLTPRELTVIRRRWGFADGEERTLEEVGQELALTTERIRQIEAKALRKLRHPARSRHLRPLWEKTI